MSGIFDRDAGKRWPRAQRFRLSEKGNEVEATYRAMLTENKAGSGGRSNFDAARAAWAAPLMLEPADGLFFGELSGGPKTIEEVADALESCGTTRREVKAAIDRLTDLHMIEPV